MYAVEGRAHQEDDRLRVAGLLLIAGIVRAVRIFHLLCRDGENGTLGKGCSPEHQNKTQTDAQSRIQKSLVSLAITP